MPTEVREGPLGTPSAFLRAAGFIPDEVTGSRVTGHADWGPDHHTPWGIVHGGVYAAAVESAASVGATLAVRERGQVAVGLTNVTHFLRPMTQGRARIVAEAVSQGRTQQLWRVEISDDAGKLVAVGELRLQNVDPPTR